MKRVIYNILPLRMIDFYIRKIKRPPCIRCDEIGVLKLNNKEYVCENCAQIISELGDAQEN